MKKQKVSKKGTNGFARFLFGISTKPNHYSMVWNGRRSLLATVILWTIWLGRVFSLLQYAKFFFRKIVTQINKADKDKKATRVNVPPVFVEIYFVIWTIVLVFGYHFAWSSLFYRCAVEYFIFESCVWLLYYTIFRRFFEEKYSLYHILEYFVVLFILLPAQAVALATVHQVPFLLVLAGLVGAGKDSTPTGITIFGAFNGAIVIAMIISSFPAEESKTKEKKQENIVIGCGDVVQNRLLPALFREKPEKSSVRVYDIKEPATDEKYIRVLPLGDAITEELIRTLTDRQVLWIASPTPTHIRYLRQLMPSRAALFVVEKPVASTLEDLEWLEDIVSDADARSKLFFLSYYLIEKALPLYYLLHRNPLYREYLNFSDELFTDNYAVLIGELKGVEVTIKEGEDKRDWVEKAGGQLLETFIHNLLIAGLFCGSPYNWQNVKLRATERNGEKSIALDAVCGPVAIRLLQSKYAKECTRYAQFVFTNGTVRCDFERQECTVCIDSMHREAVICVKKPYRNKYAVQTDLVSRVFRGKVASEDVDGLRGQIDVIRWILTTGQSLIRESDSHEKNH